MICRASLTLSEFWERVYLPRILIGASVKTIENYGLAVKHWIRVCGACPLSSIDSGTIAEFQRGLLVGRTPATANSYTRPIMAMLRLAADEEYGLLDRPPKVRFLREPKRSPLALTVSEFAEVLATARRWPGTISDCPAPDWWDAVLFSAWETGLRFTALLSLRSVDLLWDDAGLFCQAETQKDKEALWFPLQPTTLDAIRKVYDPARELLFPREVIPETVGEWFRKILDSSGIYAPKGCGMRFHRLRRSKASYTEVAGGDAQRALGHSSRSVTERYLDARIVGRSNQPAMPLPALDKLPRP